MEAGESDPGLLLGLGGGEVDAAVGQLALLHLGTGHVGRYGTDGRDDGREDVLRKGLVNAKGQSEKITKVTPIRDVFCDFSDKPEKQHQTLFRKAAVAKQIRLKRRAAAEGL